MQNTLGQCAHYFLCEIEVPVPKSVDVIFRTVHLDTLVQEEVCTWVTVNSVNATATRTLATLRLASAR